MFDLRALILGFLPLFAAPVIAHSAVQSVSTQVSAQSIGQGVSGLGLLRNSNGLARVSQIRQTLGYQIEGLSHGWSLVSTVISTEPDYSSYLITQRNGAQAPLARISGVELSAQATVGWDSGPHSAKVGWFGNLNGSPFAVQGVKASWSEGFYEKTTIVTLRGSTYLAKQPDSFFVDVDFVTRARPERIHGHEWAISCDQVLSERAKVGVELATAGRAEDRPRNVGGTLSTNYSFSDRVFGRFAATRIAELSSQALQDERGYFTLTSTEFSLTYEPWIDWLITPSYSWVLEDESDPRTGGAIRVGSDQMGLITSLRKGAWELELKLAYRRTNTALEDTVVGGGIKWRI